MLFVPLKRPVVRPFPTSYPLDAQVTWPLAMQTLIWQSNCWAGKRSEIYPPCATTIGVGKNTIRRAMHRAQCIWFTGLSGAGKTTIAQAVQERLQAQGRLVYVLDGDLLRTGLNRDLGFSDQDRSENTRRVAEVARLMVDAGVTVLVALISPFEDDRKKARALFDEGQFVEVFVDAPLLVCMRRDVKGLYAKAQQGGVPAMTGIGSPYEPPTQPDLRLETGLDSLGNCVGKVMVLVSYGESSLL